jgi:hypothetical protein
MRNGNGRFNSETATWIPVKLKYPLELELLL